MEDSYQRVYVIMAGGSGERFWPLSRKARPKQLLNLTAPDESLLQEAVGRLLPLAPAENIFVVTGRHLQQPIQSANLGIPNENVLAEPCKRNTAGCLAYAAAVLTARLHVPPDKIVMGVVTADQQIRNVDGFRACLSVAMDAAERNDAVVTLGIQPSRPETGYGYIEMDQENGPLPGSSEELPVFPVVRFREKPDAVTAGRFLAAGRFLWNAGMFFWRISTFLAEFRHANPVYADAIDTMTRAADDSDEALLDQTFEALPNISIDYALLEHCRCTLAIPANFDWDDVGAWDALDRTFEADKDGNVLVGDPVALDCEGCIVYNEPGAKRCSVAVVGGQELVVVVSDDAVLVIPKSRAQQVKAAIKQLRERGSSHL